MSTTGTIYYSTDPNSATPTWAAAGSLADNGINPGDIQALLVYDDAYGDAIIYAATKTGLYAHDSANSRFVATKLILPSHSSGGRGACVWREGCYYPAGLFIAKYVAGGTATITSIGLEREDGLVSDYRGEIVKLLPTTNEIVALVDASLSTGTGYSGVYAYDEAGWQCKWIASGADKVIRAATASSIYDYRLWFDHDSKVYYIPLQKDIRNPKHIASFPYAASGLHITPWFDAGWANIDKLALSLKVYCQGMSANETVIVKYRLDHSYADLATGWTTLGTITASGETEYAFGSSAGIAFKAIQFRFDLARGSTTTLTPDIQWFSLKYAKLLDPMWGWTFTVDC
jgi:hypothetical protein